ncbi:PTS sugar transporter subunit IIA [Enterococcus wangshanyuanii]|uniref:PTS sugar transporter subunit IIA n=1 Tax=Enterococcus wangshanyuanii TaxID=2005703 RepID=A0ABQ1NME8_9ENTE|nr:PTS sugar transporter subunit IIA [Enterococcus wangshanyuanii]GGC80217.1 PTS sugar transporter subunit IIA [Enterococcus wangshanyuanii]
MYFDSEIAEFQVEAIDKIDVFKRLTQQLAAQDFITDDFLKHVIEREEKFPTGLPVNQIGVAIPHTDSEYVKRSQIAFMSLKRPITFFEMGTSDKPVDVQMIFMLALKEPHEQLEMLQKLISMIQQEDIMEQLCQCRTKTEFIRIIHQVGLS